VSEVQGWHEFEKKDASKDVLELGRNDYIIVLKHNGLCISVSE
jgi:hypothetical protein